MRLHLLGAALLTAGALAMPSSTAQTIPLSTFDSVELRNGGKVILRHGPTPQVTLLRGSRDYTSVTSQGGSLVINKCKSRCPRGYELSVEIVTPHIVRVSITDGGTIESRGNFAQSEIAASVTSGGTIDIRTIRVDRVNASVSEGGRIFTRPQASMFATVMNGGNITYWGNAQVQSSIDGGGVVTKGDADEADKPLSELISFQESPPPAPPVPAVPPIPSTRN